jgi:hypothetical protein
MFTMLGNPFVNYLNRYTTVSPEHEAAFDEFIMQVLPPSGESLRLETKTEQFVRTYIYAENSLYWLLGTSVRKMAWIALACFIFPEL